jgi:hypothetical protein
VLRALATDLAVAGLTDIRIAAANSGATPVLAHTYTPVGAPVPPVLMAGVLPSRDGDLPRLQELGAAASGDQALLFIPPAVPRQVGEIADVRVLPIVLGGFLILLAIGAVGHALMTAVWRRSRDIAILRAFGMTPSQSRWAALTQATVFTVAGLLVGIPLGLAAGRTLWRVTAGIIPLYYQAPVAGGTLLLIGPAVLACGLLLALIPGHRAARLHAGPLLREE